MGRSEVMWIAGSLKQNIQDRQSGLSMSSWEACVSWSQSIHLPSCNAIPPIASPIASPKTDAQPNAK